jgi:hypothetical protein
MLRIPEKMVGEARLKTIRRRIGVKFDPAQLREPGEPWSLGSRGTYVLSWEEL